ncbi:ABC transporter substrate-binding protein [Paenibacillus spongiae]|uniref:Extracellular solute-binding protein n=1 Tax=Paenibacillus spongiae TaxID=2909671 RepID=A0ABY5S655_9BACL|nr:extracellular solute-binding protein [Paenibacillus spongiae]UVI29394.1 extracellular solute-binding protein [Paenibacillus spongiae]
MKWLRNRNGRRSKASLLLLSALLILLGLAGCSSPNETESEETGNQQEQAKIVDKKNIKADLKILTEWGHAFHDQFGKLFEDFNKEYPNIRVTLMEQATGDLPALIASGETPDLVIAGDLANNLTKDDLIEDLTPYMNIDPDVTPEIFYDFAYKRSVSPNGEVWALPWHVDPNFVLMYHKDVLEQYGFTEVPAMHSLEEFEDFLRRFWVVENGEQVMTTFAPHEIMGNPDSSLTTIAYLNGADSSNFFNPATNKVTFNDPKIVEALEWIVRFKRENIHDERIQKLNSTLPENMGRFQAGKSLMEPTVTLILRANYEANPDIGFALMPEESFWVSGWSWAMTTIGKKENKDAAWELLKWMTSTKAGAESQLKHFGWISGIKDDPYLEELTKTDPVMKSAYDVLQKAKKVRPYIPVNWGEEYNAKWAEVMSGTLEPKAFLDHMTQYIQALLDEQLRAQE